MLSSNCQTWWLWRANGGCPCPVTTAAAPRACPLVRMATTGPCHMSAAICAPAARTCELSPRPTCGAPTLRSARVRPGHAPRSSSAVRFGSWRLSVLGITPAAALPRELSPLPRHVSIFSPTALPANPWIRSRTARGSSSPVHWDLSQTADFGSRTKPPWLCLGDLIEMCGMLRSSRRGHCACIGPRPILSCSLEPPSCPLGQVESDWAPDFRVLPAFLHEWNITG